MEKMLSQLVEQKIAGRDVLISGVTIDTRQLSPGFLFCAVKGHSHDGHDFIAHAIAAGAAAIAVEHDSGVALQAPACVVIPNLQQEVGFIASRFYDSPSSKIPVIGITGTNGKTTISNAIADLLQALNLSCGVIGTLGVIHGDKQIGLTNTTPDAASLQKYLYQLQCAGAGAVAMEVSSHALEQRRCNAVLFNGAVFSNLSQDHLDYHGTMEAYFASKVKLFHAPDLKWAVINCDDSHYAALLKEIPPTVKVLGYSLTNAEADFFLDNINYQNGQYRAVLTVAGKAYPLQTSLQGHFNLYNMLAAVAAVYAMGYDLENIVSSCRQLRPVAGRMEVVNNDKDITALVDYAHTPDALENVLQSVRAIADGKLIVVFGCGGDRDRRKRPEMARVAEKYADRIIVTSDNPRTENQLQISNDIIAGFSHEKYTVIEDRRQAIEVAVSLAQKGDVVVVAGKGHETCQIVGNKTLPFDDRKVLRQVLSLKEGEH